jgi:hypothetical protein
MTLEGGARQKADQNNTEPLPNDSDIEKTIPKNETFVERKRRESIEVTAAGFFKTLINNKSKGSYSQPTVEPTQSQILAEHGATMAKDKPTDAPPTAATDS